MKRTVHNLGVGALAVSFAGALFFSNCSAPKQTAFQPVFQPHADPRLKQKAIVLQKKLDKAQHTLSENQQTLDRLRSQLCEAELNAIESSIESFESRWRSDPQKLMQSLRRDVPNLFLDERESLSRIIRSGPDSARAQDLLDRVLQLITQLSDYSPAV
jgi:hypothetical protein